VLTRDERARVQEALATVLASHPDARALLKVIFLTQANSILLAIPVAATPLDIASFTVTECLLDRWKSRPSLLEMLIDHLVSTQLKDGLNGLLDRVRAGIDPNPTPYDAAWLLNHSRPFFSRPDLRGQARELIEQNGQPILVVTSGEPAGEIVGGSAKRGFGLSYTGKFFEHLEDCSPADLHVLPATISAGSGPTYRIEDLLEELSAQFARSDPPPNRIGSSYPDAVARWLLRQMMQNDGLWLVLLDGFGQRPLNEEVRLAVEALAQRVTVGQFRRRIRLVLLGYPHPLPQVDSVEILNEELPPATDVRPADLRPCLIAWDDLRRSKGLPGAAPTVLEGLACELVEQAPPTGRARLQHLNAELTKLLRKP
jgi:hypothetical protein